MSTARSRREIREIAYGLEGYGDDGGHRLAESHRRAVYFVPFATVALIAEIAPGAPPWILAVPTPMER